MVGCFGVSWFVCYVVCFDGFGSGLLILHFVGSVLQMACFVGCSVVDALDFGLVIMVGLC